MSEELLPGIARRLRDRSPKVVDLPNARRAAVAVTLAPKGGELSLLLIRRADHEGDPWSGQMAFPGGHRDSTDASLRETAIRETREEVGVHLDQGGEFIARLDDVQGQARGKALGMVVTPFAFSLDQTRTPTIDESEVAEAIWVPLHVFREEAFHGTTPIHRGDFRADFPAFLYEGHAVWGMTYRMIRDFLEAAALDDLKGTEA